jgi:hypothetical protein
MPPSGGLTRNIAMADSLVCWRCGAQLKDHALPLGRRSECPACQAELHVCRMCRHYDTAKAKHCREPMAEEVKDKTRANFCEWLQPRADAYSAAARSPDRESPERAVRRGRREQARRRPTRAGRWTTLFGCARPFDAQAVGFISEC